MQTMRFAISLLVKASRPKTANDFPFRFVQSHEAVGVGATRRHVLAFEEGKEIFDVVIAPVMHPTIATNKDAPNAVMIESDSDEEDVPVQKIVKTSRFSK